MQGTVSIQTEIARPTKSPVLKIRKQLRGVNSLSVNYMKLNLVSLTIDKGLRNF